MTQTTDSSNVKVEVETTMGSFTVLLYGDTPRHRDNFVKLVREGYYDGTLFHRVINEFMVQAGDPDSRTAKPGQQLGAGGPDYKIDAEIVYPKHFHKRGALAAARQGDQVNPTRQSSGSQFYVVTGKKLAEGDLARIEQYMQQSERQSVFNRKVQELRRQIMQMQQAGDQAGLNALQQRLIAETDSEVAANPARLTPEQRTAYTTEGGTPHLDGQYTVFGEVVSGMDVIDKIEKVPTGAGDRPREDVRIIKMKIKD
ncbi:MAG: peptidylprolyl isomerase [Muribaculaceae bacterium]|nr:peptidylprolyl isomerase [Muribaculaceae bacterium]MDE6487271.1 peptidylprolyl isomerase [Muribaculaceae bacterium]